ncbi:hypothetical protein IAT38_001832 [Cryptococcus sp. DSM 104549]
MSCFIPSARRPGIRLPDDPSRDPLLADEKPAAAEKYEPSNLDALDLNDELEERLRDIKKEIEGAKVDWYVVPSEDEHQSEEVGETEKRRQYISGFTGSAGTAVIPASSSSPALLFVDSRYWIQAEQQVPESWKVVRVGSQGGASGKDAVVGGWVEWVVNEAEDGAKIGIDPKLISLDLAQSIKSRLADTDSTTELVPLSSNLVDKIHTPSPRSAGPILPYPIDLSGEDTPSKLARVRDALSSRVSSSLTKTSPSWVYILPTLPAIAWLLNFRCPDDIPFCPVAYAYVVLTEERCVVFVDEAKLSEKELRQRWKGENVEVRGYGVEEVGKFVKELVEEGKKEGEGKGGKVKVLAPRECSWALAEECSPTAIQTILCPVDTLKAVKNRTEQQGFRSAYLRDGRAMVRWMAWLEKTILQENRKVGEWAAAQTLTRYRAKETFFAGLAYEDISASGPNAALPHYAPQRGKDRLIDPDATYVIDSGAQYLDATIDTTRTLYFGKDPSPEIKRAYTRVLQGHIAVSLSTFPRGMTADRLNMIARGPLYQDGLDFGHGIGHGVGSYLAVHENPMFSRTSAFEPGHITTIEPGYYKEGEFGIRIESVLLCKPIVLPDNPDSLKETNFLRWERITQVPIQTSLVDWSLLAKYEMRWLNKHNKQVEEALEPLLQADEDRDAREWLKRECKQHKIWPWDGV